MKLSLSQAAIEAGVAKSTISRAIKLGHLSATPRAKGPGYDIDPAELFRVYPKKPNATPEPEPAPTMDETKLELELLRAAEAQTKTLVETLQEQIEDLKRQRDSWQNQAETQTRLLVHSKETTPEPEPEVAPVKKGLFSKLFG